MLIQAATPLPEPATPETRLIRRMGERIASYIATQGHVSRDELLREFTPREIDAVHARAGEYALAMVREREVRRDGDDDELPDEAIDVGEPVPVIRNPAEVDASWLELVQ